MQRAILISYLIRCTCVYICDILGCIFYFGNICVVSSFKSILIHYYKAVGFIWLNALISGYTFY